MTGHTAHDLTQIGAPGQAKLAVVVAAAGGHHLWLSGTPGTGRVMLAAATHTLLPDLNAAQTRETARLAALSPDAPTSVTAGSRRPPWQAPHHTASVASVIGGRSDDRFVPGTVSLAHHGVLFLEQAGELPSRLVHAIATSVHYRQVVLTSAGTSVTFPARFQLMMATEPCPAVVHRPDESCTCSPLVRQRYRQRVAALAARCDLRVDLNGPASDGDPYTILGRSNADLAARVATARQRARRRWRGHGCPTNADATAEGLTAKPTRLPATTTAELDERHSTGAVSSRGRTAVLRVAWTLADLAGRSRPNRDDVGTALLLYGHG